jgi:hypothetical protein
VAVDDHEQSLRELHVRSGPKRLGRLMAWQASFRSGRGRSRTPPGSATCSSRAFRASAPGPAGRRRRDHEPTIPVDAVCHHNHPKNWVTSSEDSFGLAGSFALVLEIRKQDAARNALAASRIPLPAAFAPKGGSWFMKS